MGRVVGNEVNTNKSHKRRTHQTSVRHHGRSRIHYRVAPVEMYRFPCLLVDRNNKKIGSNLVLVVSRVVRYIAARELTVKLWTDRRNKEQRHF